MDGWLAFSCVGSFLSEKHMAAVPPGLNHPTKEEDGGGGGERTKRGGEEDRKKERQCMCSDDRVPGSSYP